MTSSRGPRAEGSRAVRQTDQRLILIEHMFHSPAARPSTRNHRKPVFSKILSSPLDRPFPAKLMIQRQKQIRKTCLTYPSGFAILKVEIKFGASSPAFAFSFGQRFPLQSMSKAKAVRADAALRGCGAQPEKLPIDLESLEISTANSGKPPFCTKPLVSA